MVSSLPCSGAGKRCEALQNTYCSKNLVDVGVFNFVKISWPQLADLKILYVILRIRCIQVKDSPTSCLIFNQWCVSRAESHYPFQYKLSGIVRGIAGGVSPRHPPQRGLLSRSIRDGLILLQRKSIEYESGRTIEPALITLCMTLIAECWFL